MPEKDEIVKNLSALLPRVIGRGSETKAQETWEGNEYGAKFMVTRERFSLHPIDTTFYCLSVSGRLRESRLKVIEDFTKALGHPTDADFLRNSHFCMWDVRRIKAKDN